MKKNIYFSELLSTFLDVIIKMYARPVFNREMTFKGNRIEKDTFSDTIHALKRQQLPLITSTNLPPGTLPGVGGAIAYDLTTQRPYYSDGYTWKPIGGNGSSIISYYIVKLGDLIIPPATPIQITSWGLVPHVGHTIPGWDLATGIYTAAYNQYFGLNLAISWRAFVSNLGIRSVTVQCKIFPNAFWTDIKYNDTQGNPETASATVQSYATNFSLQAGDQVRLRAKHTAGINLIIGSGPDTTISGFVVAS